MKRQIRVAKYIVYKETAVDWKEHFWTFIGGFVGIGLIGLIQSHILPDDNIFLIGSFGASAVLVYGVINSPLAQPRNLVGGHVISAFIGVTVMKFVPGETWFLAAVAVACAIVGMQMTKTLHPPGGATSLIAILGSAKIKALGYFYVLSPVFSGVMILLIVALIVNNMTKLRSYPKARNWYRFWEKRYR